MLHALLLSEKKKREKILASKYTKKLAKTLTDVICFVPRYAVITQVMQRAGIKMRSYRSSIFGSGK